MSGLSFRDRKHHRTFNSQYYVKNGDKHVDLDGWREGDAVGVLFELQPEVRTAINESDEDVYLPDMHVLIPCIVVKRTRSIVWAEFGTMQDHGVSVVLEAADGMWEDILAWIIVNQKPEWV